MAKYLCTASRRIADDIYVVGETYQISNELAARYRGYFDAIAGEPEPAKAAPVTRAPKPSSTA